MYDQLESFVAKKQQIKVNSVLEKIDIGLISVAHNEPITP